MAGPAQRTRTREEVHQLVLPWVEGTEVVHDPLADSGLWGLHAANLSRDEYGVLRHGVEGEPVHSAEDLQQLYWLWSENVRLREEDPRAWTAMLLAQRREMKSYRDNLR